MGISSLTSAEVIAGSLFEKRLTSSDAERRVAVLSEGQHKRRLQSPWLHWKLSK